MKKLVLLSMLVAALGQNGCAFVGGAAGGALGTSAGYEYNAHGKMNRLEDDYKHDRVSRAEYESHKSQIEKASIIY